MSTLNTLSIIPAKIGSTRLHQKNIRLLNDKPLINYTIEHALESQICDKVMVSTDSEKVAGIAAEAGAEVPFMRPPNLGKDPYGVVDVCLHVLDEYEKRDIVFKKLIILLPTTPLRITEDILKANRIFDKNNAKFLMSVSEFEHNPFGALTISGKKENVMVPCFKDTIGKKRHELPNTYRVNGAVCILDVDAFRKSKSYFGNPLYTYIMPWQRSIDIDTESDFLFAEYLLLHRTKK